MRLIKSYFLISTKNIIGSGLMISAAILFIVYLITGWCNVIYFLGLGSFIAYINHLVIKTKITIPPCSSTKIILAHYPDGPKIIEAPVWGKIPLTSIKLPSDDWKYLTDIKVDTLTIRMERTIKDGVIGNITLLLYIYFSGPFKAIDLVKCFNIENSIAGLQKFSLEDRIEKIFDLANQDSYTEILEKIYEGEIKKSRFKNMIIEETNWPNLWLSNITGIGISVNWFGLEKRKAL